MPCPGPAPARRRVPVPGRRSVCWRAPRGRATRGPAARCRAAAGRPATGCQRAARRAAGAGGRARRWPATTAAVWGQRRPPAPPTRSAIRQARSNSVRSPTRPAGLSSGIPRANTSRPSCGRRSSQSAAQRIWARASSWRRSASASSAAPRAAGASAGSSSRERSSVSVAAMTVQAAQGPTRLPSRSARAACIARENASIRAPIDSRARSIFLARAISSSQSSGPAKPSIDRTGAPSVGSPRGGSSQAETIDGAGLGARSAASVTARRRRDGCRSAAPASTRRSAPAPATASSRPTRSLCRWPAAQAGLRLGHRSGRGQHRSCRA